MKKLQMLALLFLSLFFVLACTSDDDEDFTDTFSDETSDKTDSEPVNDNETIEPSDDTEPVSGDDTEPVSGDDTEPVSDDDTEPVSDDDTEPVSDSDTEPVSDDDTEPVSDGDTEPVSDDDTEPVSDDDTTGPDEDVPPAPGEICTAAGGTWNETEETCTKITDCIGRPEENTVWNGASSYTQTYADGTWSAEIAAEYNEEEGACHFTCSSGHVWDGSNCSPDPLLSIPECSAASGTPCKDSASQVWSKKSSATKYWSKAAEDCDTLDEGGFTWRLPEIWELRMLITDCTKTQADAETCMLSDDHLGFADGTNCGSCTSNSTGKYSILGDTETLWSATKVSDYSSSWVWILNFKKASFDYDSYSSSGDFKYKFRCIKK